MVVNKVKSVVPVSVKKTVKAHGSKPTHPPTAEMVNAAIQKLKERKGSSLQAIKKYVAATYKLDADKFSPFIKKYLKNAIASGVLIQPKGHGASGSFKLATKESKPKTKKSVTSEVAKLASPKKATLKAKKVVAEKKRTTKVAAKLPKAKSTTAKIKNTKTSLKKTTKVASMKVSTPKTKKPTAKKVAVK